MGIYFKINPFNEKPLDWESVRRQPSFTADMELDLLVVLAAMLRTTGLSGRLETGCRLMYPWCWERCEQKDSTNEDLWVRC